MISVGDVVDLMERFAPSRLAEPWDNVGLLVGDRAAPAGRMMTCLTLAPATVAEAIEDSAQLVVTHHPLPFRPLGRLTADAHAGRLLLDLIRAGVAVVSPHTAFDSADEGINEQLARGLGLAGVEPLVPPLAENGLPVVGGASEGPQAQSRQAAASRPMSQRSGTAAC